jgi:hypothetical protein
LLKPKYHLLQHLKEINMAGKAKKPGRAHKGQKRGTPVKPIPKPK